MSRGVPQPTLRIGSTVHDRVEGAERERDERTKHWQSTSTTTRGSSRVLALLGTTALGLAASPAAFASDRGGPGSPNAQQVHASAFLPVSKLPQRFAVVSWSD